MTSHCYCIDATNLCFSCARSEKRPGDAQPEADENLTNDVGADVEPAQPPPEVVVDNDQPLIVLDDPDDDVIPDVVVDVEQQQQEPLIPPVPTDTLVYVY